MKPPIVVIGGGAAGMMAALTARRQGAAVTLLERNPKLGRKLYITGKGRCNLTNACAVDQVLASIPRNGRFLYSAMSAFPPSETMDFFQNLGVPLKIERGNRVFPASDKSSDVIDALFFALRRAGVAIVEDRAIALEYAPSLPTPAIEPANFPTASARVSAVVSEGANLPAASARVSAVAAEGANLPAQAAEGANLPAQAAASGRVSAVVGAGGVFPCAAAIVATGGLSYPATGSTGDGYALARSAGHSVVPPRGSLVPLEAEGCAPLQGLSLKNVRLTVVSQKNKVLFADQGELLFTHFGLSGPLVLSASAHLRHFDQETYTAHIDLKPALTLEQLEGRVTRDLEEYSNRDMANYALTLVPRLLAPAVLERAGVSGRLKLNSLTRGARRALCGVLKDLAFPIRGPRPVEEAIVTTGGVDVREVDPRTMGSKLVENLYFAGEVLDADGYTGGFNLQIAWATGHAAGVHAGQIWKGATP